MLTEKQLEMRRTGIGASEIAALAGLSKWASPIEIYESKVLGERKETTLAMKLGDLFEEPIARLYREETGLFVRKSGTLRHPSLEYAIATPDRLVFDAPKKQAVGEADRLLQIKATSMRGEWGEPGTGDIPEAYMAQVQWEMGTSGHYLCDVAALFTGFKREFGIYRVEFSSEVFGRLYEIAELFMTDHVLKKVPPPPDASEQYGEFLKRAYPVHTSGLVKEATPEIIDAALLLRAAEAEGKASEARAEQAKNQIKAFMGEAEILDCGTLGQLTWKANKGSEKTDWKVAFDKLAEDYRGRQAGSEEAENTIAAAIREATEKKPGARPLLKKWAK